MTATDMTTVISDIISDNIGASPSRGEIFFDGPAVGNKNIGSLTPITCILDGIKSFVHNFKDAIKNKKRLIPAIIFSLTWIVLTLFPLLKIDNTALRFLSFLTYARGGITGGGFLGAVGGIIGKGVFSYFLSTLIMPLFGGKKPFAALKTSFYKILPVFRTKDMHSLPFLLAGIGASFAAYNFITGNDAIVNGIAGISACLLSLRALANRNGFLRKLVASFISKKGGRINDKYITAVFAGFSAGFLPAMLFVFVPFAYTGYCAGIALLLASFIMMIIVKKKNPAVKIASLIFALMLIPALLPNSVSAAGGSWNLVDVIDSENIQALESKREQYKNEYQYDYSYTRGSYMFKSTYIKSADEFSPIQQGDTTTTYVTFTSPENKIEGGSEITVTMNIRVENHITAWFSNGSFSAHTYQYDQQKKECGAYLYSITDDKGNGTWTVTAEAGKTETLTKEISAVMAPGTKNGEQIAVSLRPGSVTETETLYIYEWSGGSSSGSNDPADIVVNTNASPTSGEIGVSVPAAIVINIAATVISVGSVGVIPVGGGGGGGDGGGGGGDGDGGSDGDDNKEDDDDVKFRMYIYKEFGDSIRYNAQPVTVYARMAEIRNGTENDRPDLTERIDIFSGTDCIDVSGQTLTGNYKGALVYAQSQSGNNAEGIVCFRFTGEGSFQNNVRFKLIGDAYIDFSGKHGNKVMIAAARGGSYELPFAPVNFTGTPAYSLPKTDFGKFALELSSEGGTQKIIVKECGEKYSQIDKFRESFSAELIAKSETEECRSTFDVIVCYEGLLADFWGKDKVIYAYQDKNGDMKKTLIGFSLGLWNDGAEDLDVLRPQNLSVDADDENGIFKLIGVSYKPDPDSSLDNIANYIFTAEKPLPSLNNVKGSLKATCENGGTDYSYAAEIELVPDIQEYSKNLELEYERCKYIINTYLPETMRNKKLAELEKSRRGFGIEDYIAFRRKCWEFAQRLIMQDKESYLVTEAYADFALSQLELWKAIGDVAFDVALAPLGGPLASIVIGQAKNSVIDLITMFIDGKTSYDDFMSFLDARLVQLLGSADGFVEMPKATDYKKLAVWFACFFVYRFWYHYKYDTDSDGNPAGIIASVKSTAIDIGVKGVMSAGLDDFLKTVSAKQSIVKRNLDKIYNKDADDLLMKPLTDAGGKAFNSFAEMLLDFIDRVKSGGIIIT